MSILTAYLSVLLFFLVLSVEGKMTGLVIVLAVVNAVSVYLFGFYIGRLALLLDKNWILWAFGSVIVSPFGAIVAYVKMRKLAIEKGWWEPAYLFRSPP